MCAGTGSPGFPSGAEVVSANASTGGQEQTRLRSPWAPSTRRTGGQYFVADAGRHGRVGRQLARVRVVPLAATRHAAVCGALRSGLSSSGHSPAATRSISPLIAIIAVDEAVELGEVLALGRLDHQRAGDRERHRRRVEAVVDEPLGDVVDGHARRLR